MDMSKLEMLARRCADCSACSLAQTRKNLVFGTGSESSPLMFVGEGPGEQEDLRGEPFVGRAGKLLDDMLAMAGLHRGDVYIANIVKCRPPQNRDPLAEEQDACIHWLYGQIDAIQPKLIVCLGRIAAMRLIRADFRITREHGKWFERDGRAIMATYHPAALLRDASRRPEAFDDLMELRGRLRSLGQ